MKDGDTTITSTPDLCKKFNNYFSTVVNQYLPESNQAPDFHKLNDFVKSKITEDDVLSIPLLTCDEVQKSLHELDSHKATGLDGLSSKILKLSASVIASPLTVIFNQSISYGYFPIQWKTARITPVHKSGSRTDKNNYRPIYILCVVSKLLERHYHNCITAFLTSYDLLYKGQSGFRRYHSCESAITKLVDTWLINIEHGKLNGVTLIDFRKAFDMINVHILVSKLQCYHFDDVLIKWMYSYLTGISQCVQVKNCLSSPAPISYGVPQGSILGPLLFILFANDIHLHSDLELDLYADDSTSHSSGKTINELNEKLTTAMEDIQQWCLANGMVINEKKTKSMVVSTYQKAAKIGSIDLFVKHNGSVLKNVRCEKVLGLIIDNHLSWEAHIDELASNLSKIIALFRRIKIYLPLNTRILFYKTFFQSRIDYCCTIWGQSAHISRIYKLQKLILRLIYDKSKFYSSKPLFEQSKILPIKYRVMYRVAILVYKAVNNLSPDYLSSLFKPASSVSQCRTRSSSNMNLWVPNFKLSITRKGPQYNGAVIYNMLPPDIKSSGSLYIFKRKVYNFILNLFICSS